MGNEHKFGDELADELAKDWKAQVATMTAEKAERYLRALGNDEDTDIGVAAQVLIIADWLKGQAEPVTEDIAVGDVVRIEVTGKVESIDSRGGCMVTLHGVDVPMLLSACQKASD